MSTVASPATLRATVLPRAGWATAVALAVAGVAVHTASAQVAVPLPFTPVPLTLQTLSVLLLAAAYGPRLATATFASYLALGMAGAPVFSLGRNGLAVLATPSLGYLLGMLAATVAVGYLARRRWDRRPLGTVAMMVVGNAVIYVGGVAWWLVLGFGPGEAVAGGVVPFLPGDALKIAIAAGVLPGTWALVRRLRDQAGTREE
ncbi:MAG: biotin transporter BioY [Kineosporiaceae bacterium]